MSASPGSSQANMAGHCHSQHGHCYGCGSTSMGVGDEAPWFGPTSHSRPGSPTYFTEDEHGDFMPSALSGPSRNSTRKTSRSSARYHPGGHRYHSRHLADHINNRAISRLHSHDGRFSAYTNTMRQSRTCFLGTHPMNPNDANFHDQSIRFRVIDCTSSPQEDGQTQREREMLVVSSPGNMRTVMDTLAPLGSGRRIVVRAVDRHGIPQQGDEEFLAFTVLPQGWPFDLVLEEE